MIELASWYRPQSGSHRRKNCRNPAFYILSNSYKGEPKPLPSKGFLHTVDQPKRWRKHLVNLSGTAAGSVDERVEHARDVSAPFVDKGDVNIGEGERARVRDYRAVPIEVLRDFARSQTEITSIRTVAEEIGLGRSTLHKFILGRTNPQPRVRRLLALWYLDKIGRAHHMDVARPYVAALDVLLSGIPDEQRTAAQRGLLNALTAIHADIGTPTPRWLEVLRSPGM